MAQPRFLGVALLDYDKWHAGRVVVRPVHPLDSLDGESIAESIVDDEAYFSVVRWVTGHGDRNAVIMDECEQYYLARVAK